jgi:hypothetical protein
MSENTCYNELKRKYKCDECGWSIDGQSRCWCPDEEAQFISRDGRVIDELGFIHFDRSNT